MHEFLEYLRTVPTNESAVPDGCLTFAEEALYVSAAITEAYNNTFEQIGISELAVYESTGSVVVYEGARMDNFKNKIKEMFGKFMAAIKKAYEKILDWFESIRKKANSKLTGLKSFDPETLKDVNNLGKTHKFDLDCIDIKANVASVNDDIKDACEKVIKSGYEENKDLFEDIKKTLHADLANGAEGSSSITDASSLKEKVKAAMLGEEIEVDTGYISSNFDELKKIVLDGKLTRDIKASYKAEKENLAKMQKNVESIIKDAAKEDGSDAEKAISAAATIYKDIAATMHLVMAIKIDVCKTRYRDAYRLLSIVKSHSKKATGESYTGMVSSQVDLVAEAFNW